MRHYEIPIIFDANLEEDAIRSVLERVQGAISAQGGKPGRVERWGRRRFAYELAHRSEGYYVLVEAAGEPAAVDEAARVLSLADEVLRHKVIRLPDGAGGGRATPPARRVDEVTNGEMNER